ncbi:3-carboxy-cis,cis-muconate cycloisomerase [Acrocarpospora phusangensis]|uniref:3-carboxy-cis,cis-muconate cycloisomerase n=1 Tax=Acrocarpospora phusangensis TaxID=1070424 RepID=A0A919QAK3_9ACTN|nr:3-carboxy-cis,cis-muconate cycloisomerase [Acrocarpospora phusangensis]GIH25103.1 3-carboxy-cis,cis-muconate cycloisomerase [Acrocarpospora phusangensis]
MNSDDLTFDTGLLAPIWAGSPAEAATGDLAFLRAMLDAEVALARAQAAEGLISAGAVKDVTTAADALAREGTRTLALLARSGGNPVIPLVKALTKHAPEVHLGATSQDIMDTAFMLVAARTRAVVTADLDRTAVALARLAAAHRDTPMAGRTLTQHAVPTTFGLKAAGWRELVLDARDRLNAVVLPVQLGGAAGTMAAFEALVPRVDERRLLAGFAAQLGLAEPRLPWHTLRTPVADLAAALAFVTGALGKMAADVLVLSRTEIAEVAEGTGGGSSALPHKRNPVGATLIAASARSAPALAAVLFGSLAAEDERPSGAWHAEWSPLRDLLRHAGGSAAHAAVLAEGLRVDAGRMRANLDLTGGLIVAERLTAVLTPAIGRREARHLMERASLRVAADGISLRQAVLRETGPGDLDLTDLDELCDPATYLGSAAALTDQALTRRPAGDHDA